MEKIRGEPGYKKSQFTPIYGYIRSVLLERLELCQRFFIPGNVSEAIIAPLRALLMRAEKSQLDAFEVRQWYPVVLGSATWEQVGVINWHGYGSRTKQKQKLTKEYRRILVRFMDKLGRARDEMYAELRMQQETGAIPPQPSGQRFPWCYMIADGFLKDLPWEADAPFLADFIRKVCSMCQRWLVTKNLITDNFCPV